MRISRKETLPSSRMLRALRVPVLSLKQLRASSLPRHLSTLRFAKSHEWVSLGDDGIATIGVSDYAQKQLGDLVYVELPDVDSEFQAEEDFACVESVKSSNNVYMPIGGTIVETNEALLDNPELVNSSPMDDAWMVRVKVGDNVQEEMGKLFDEDAYMKMIEVE